jgi:hypothetical protein
MPKHIDRETGLTEDQTEYLLTGMSWGELAGGAFKTPEDEARTWKQNRARLISRYQQKHGPFCRPWAWWKHDAPELRRRIGGEGVAAIDTDDCPEWAKDRVSFGRPVVWDDDYGDEVETWFETERDYLIRLNLLTPEEKKILLKQESSNSPESTGTIH